jgi:hypothetical protein
VWLRFCINLKWADNRLEDACLEAEAHIHTETEGAW